MIDSCKLKHTFKFYFNLLLGFPSGYLDLAQAYSVLQSSIQHGKIQGSDIEKNRTNFVVCTCTHVFFTNVMVAFTRNDTINILCICVIRQILTIRMLAWSM